MSMQIAAIPLAVFNISAAEATPVIDEPAAIETVSIIQQDVVEASGELRPPPPQRPPSVFRGDWIALGGGGVFSSTYNGSDNYRALMVPVIAGSYKGIGFRPRAGGLSFDFLDGSRGDVRFSFGPTFRFRGGRDNSTRDEVVEAAGDLDTAFELGVQGGVTLRKIFSRFDRVSIGLDVQFDVAGAHSGYLIDPGISYSTPISRGAVVALSIGGQYVDGDFADYYYSVSPEQSAASGLPTFQADSGWHKAGATLAMGFDASGDIRDGGWVYGGAIGYRRALGDAADTPYTSLRGDPDQFSFIFGFAYVF